MTQGRVFLSTSPVTDRDRRLALTVVLASTAIFIATAPFAKAPLVPLWAFIPTYETALVMNDLITAVLLFGQVAILRSRALWILATAYAFTAFMTVAHALTFPGLFSATGLLGAGPQSTAWLYMFWHGGFPLFLIGYARTKDTEHATRVKRGSGGRAILGGTSVALALAAVFTVLATAGQDYLPAIMAGNRYTPAMMAVVSSTWSLSLLALIVLWRRRTPSLLDVWLMVVMCAWLFDIALAAVLNGGRFDLGFYAGRVYGLFAATFVLGVLLLENGLLHARLVQMHEQLEDHNRSLEQTVRDRTERLLQSEKVATMGSLLAGVAHELNNPLAVLSGHAQLLREIEGTASPAVVRRADKITEAADRCVRIVRNFLALARQRRPERTAVSLPHVITGAVELLAYPLRTDGIDVALDIPPSLPTLSADPHALHQVLVNLIANAHQAMRRQPPPRCIAVTARHDAAHGRISLEVADTGPGIPPDIRAKIFEPFFTTKPAGEGTGLGLSLCRGIIEEHGGTIEVESDPGRGTRFVIELPVISVSRAAAEKTDAEAMPIVTPRTVLVVDDEADVAGVIAEALGRDGHRADTAINGAMALEMLDRRTYDLVLSDTKMPVLDGEAFYAELGRRFPALQARMIFVTADVLSHEKREFLERTGRPFLTKPCDLDELRRLVQRTLARSTSPVDAARGGP